MDQSRQFVQVSPKEEPTQAQIKAVKKLQEEGLEAEIVSIHDWGGEIKIEGEVNRESADFSKLDLRHAIFFEVDLSGVDFDGADLQDAWFFDCSIRDSDFSRADLSNSHSSYCDFRGIQFPKSSSFLDGISLCGRDLRDADLRGVSLSAATLEWFDLKKNEVKIKGARYDRKAKWPEGFDPKAHGAILVRE